MTTATNTVPAKAGDIQLAPQTYQQSMNGLNAMVDSNASASGVVSIQPGQLSVVQVQAGKQYKLRKTGNPNQIPDDLIAVRHGDALHVRYADGSVVHFEGFFSTCTDSSVCSVNLASDSAAGSTLGADALSSGPVADDGMLVYAHGNANVLMSMAQDQSGLSAAIQSAGLAGNVTYLAASPILGSSLFAMLAAGGLAAAASATTAPALIGVPAIAEQDLALTRIGNAAASNNASGTTTPAVAALTLSDYTNARVTGVNSTNLAAINSALDSVPIAKEQANTTAKLQIIVNAYTAILASANGTAGDAGTALTGAQYTAIGVSGVSGVAADGNALKLLNEVVDGKPTTGVDLVTEVQALADAAAHVMTAAAGTPSQAAVVTQADLVALGVTGVTDANLASIQAAISGSADNGTGVDTQAELVALATGAINAHPSITSALSGVLNLDVTSSLVFSASQTVTVGTGFIHITDLGGSTASGGTGYYGDTTTNNQTIDVATAVASGFLTITGTGANTKIIVNPKWDLDLSSNYQISIDDTAFLDAGGNNSAVHFAPINFSTVTPGTHNTGTVVTEAVASQIMSDTTGALVVSKSWLNIQGIGSNNGSMTQLGDLSGGQFALVMKNYATVPGGGGAGADRTDGISTHDTNIGVQNFGANDIVYFDSQTNTLSQQLFDAHYTSMTNGANVGGLAGQNTLVMGLMSAPQQQGSTAMIALGLEGNTANTIYPAVYTLGANTAGWADAWHNASAPLIMG